MAKIRIKDYLRETNISFNSRLVVSSFIVVILCSFLMAQIVLSAD